MDPDAETKARAIVLAARPAPRRWPRGLWILTLVIGVASVVALAIAWWQDHDTVSDHPLDTHAATPSSGLGVGLMVGLGAGIAIGSLIAVRRRHDR